MVDDGEGPPVVNANDLEHTIPPKKTLIGGRNEELIGRGNAAIEATEVFHQVIKKGAAGSERGDGSEISRGQEGGWQEEARAACERTQAGR